MSRDTRLKVLPPEVEVQNLSDDHFKLIVNDLASYWDDPDAMHFVPPIALHWPPFLQRTQDTSFAIIKDGTLVCYLISEFMEIPQPSVIIYALATRRDFRRAGFASRICQYLFDIAAFSGRNTIIAVPPNSEQTTQSFFEQLGMTPHVAPGFDALKEQIAAFSVDIALVSRHVSSVKSF